MRTHAGMFGSRSLHYFFPTRQSFVCIGAAVDSEKENLAFFLDARRMGERLLAPFETFGWTPNDDLSEDVNFMDLVLLVTRSSKLKQGSMACIIVRPSESSREIDGIDGLVPLTDRIVSVANNQELYAKNSSDVHAEIVALGQAARFGRATEGCTAYITIPPCKRCFGALLAAGIKRIVTLYPPPKLFHHLMNVRQVEMIGGVHDKEEQRLRIDHIVSSYSDR